MKRTALVATLSASVLAISAGQAFAEYSLNILHINDWHSRIESISKYDSTCSAEDEGEGKCFGGAARLVTAVREARAAMSGDNVIFLNAGDNFQGSLFYTTYKGAAEAEFLGVMKPDVMTVGNHEFDDGEEGLAGFLDKVGFPVISSNILASDKSKLNGRINPSIVVEIGGQKIGVIGAVANDTAELSSPGDNVLITQDVAGVAAAVKELESQGINKIIALTHVGYARDVDAIAKIPGVDVVVGGHSHTYLANNDDKAAGPYPTWVDNPSGEKVPVVQAGSYSKYLGELKVTFDDDGVVTGATGAPMLLDASVKPDEAVTARIKELGAPIEALKAKPVSQSTGPIEGSREVCRAMECAMGDLVADAMLDRVKSQGIQIAVQNGGGLRASIDAGEITMGEVLTVLPFQNTLSTFQLKGSDVVAALENGVSQIEEGAGRFPQVAGLKFSFDKSKEPGNRVSNVMVMDGDGYKPIDPAKTYGVVSNNFMRAGGDGYKVFASNGMNAYDYGPGLEQVVADYLAANAPYQPLGDTGRITDVTPMMTEEKPAGDMKAEEPKAEMKAEEPKAEMKTEMKPAEDKMMMKGEEYVIQKGDNFWDLSRKFYGDARMWNKLAEANPSMKAKGLQIGAKITVPPAN